MRRSSAIPWVVVILGVLGMGTSLPAVSGLRYRLAGAVTPSAFLQRDGNTLLLDGEPYRFVGTNAYSLATMWGANLGCGGPVDPDALFASLPPRAVVRMWGWQGSMATNPRTGARDWTGLDRVVATAERHGVLLAVSLTSQGGECDDGHWKDQAWFSGGYRQHRNDDGYSVTTTSYWDYVHEIVGRYARSPAIGLWELVNEPEASECPPGYSSWRCGGHQRCPDQRAAAVALRGFFDVVGGEIKRIDPNHLIGSGVLGTGQCGIAGNHYSFVHGSPGIDVTSYHDYGAPRDAAPGDSWNGLGVRLVQSRSLGKPLMVGEAGIEAGEGSGECPSRARRARQFGRKLESMFAAGVSGFLTWNAVAHPSAGCTLDIASDDPAFTLLRNYRLR